MAGFVQIIEFTTSRFDDVQALNDSYRAGRAGRGGGPTRVTVVADRERANTYLTIAEFGSYDAAMANSNDPETTAFAQKMGELCDGPPTFYNSDLVWSDTMS